MPSALVNDVQSRLNATRVAEVRTPTSLDDLQAALRDARNQNRPLCIAGGRHAMGTQQFATDAILLDTTKFNRVLKFDRVHGHITLEAGIEWPDLFRYLHEQQGDSPKAWAVREKQTGVDKVSIAGSLSSNVHGRSLKTKPMVSDIESFTLLLADGTLRVCSRTENQELFSLAIGGYGLFGIVVDVTLRLVERTKVERVVEVISVRDLLSMVQKRLDEGFVYGDCQYSTDLGSEAAQHPGVFSCYRPVAPTTPMPKEQKHLDEAGWMELYRLARTDKKKAFEKYSSYYLSTNGQIYWSDLHQLAGSLDSYRKLIDEKSGTPLITEIYVGADEFLPFMATVRQDYIDHKVDMTYGTIRFIEQDSETFLAWAKKPSVCIVCNLNVMHTEAGKEKAAAEFRRIIDRAIEFGGSFYLTYHRFATRKQLETCYPQFVDFLRLKKKYDPQERFQSDWYRHYKQMFADKLGNA